jgi:hypothetical protein
VDVTADVAAEAADQVLLGRVHAAADLVADGGDAIGFEFAEGSEHGGVVVAGDELFLAEHDEVGLVEEVVGLERAFSAGPYWVVRPGMSGSFMRMPAARGPAYSVWGDWSMVVLQIGRRMPRFARSIAQITAG